MRDIGVDVKTPEGEWDGSDSCPFHGSLRLRGQIIEGTVFTSGMTDSIVVERETTRYMKKYERYEAHPALLRSPAFLHRRRRRGCQGPHHGMPTSLEDHQVLCD